MLEAARVCSGQSTINACEICSPLCPTFNVTIDLSSDTSLYIRTVAQRRWMRTARVRRASRNNQIKLELPQLRSLRSQGGGRRRSTNDKRHSDTARIPSGCFTRLTLRGAPIARDERNGQAPEITLCFINSFTRESRRGHLSDFVRWMVNCLRF